MRRRIIWLTVALGIGFAVLLVQLTNLSVISAGGLRGHELNTRAATAAFGNARGAIISADGEELAFAISHEDTETPTMRTYPHGRLYAHIVGYLSPVAGAAGIERSYDSELSGTDPSIAMRTLTDLFTDSDQVGDVVLSVNHGAQLTARAALGDRDGAVVVINPATGALIAMWSRPSFDPEEAFVAASAEPVKSRAYQHHYALRIDDSRVSAGADLLAGARRATGATGIDLPAEPDSARVPHISNDPNDNGHNNDNRDEWVQLTPLQLALVAAAVVNDGLKMTPFVVQQVNTRSAGNADDAASSTHEMAIETTPRAAGRIFSATEAARLLARMTAEAQEASIDLRTTDDLELPVSITTGQLVAPGGSGTGSWSVLAAPADAPAVVAAVVIEPDVANDVWDTQGGSTLATKIAATVAEAALALGAVAATDADTDTETGRGRL